MKSKDFHVNFGGEQIPVKHGYLYILLIDSCGNGDQSEWCKFHNTYHVFECFEDTLKNVGTIYETLSRDGNSFSGDVRGERVVNSFYPAGAFFRKIFKNE